MAKLSQSKLALQIVLYKLYYSHTSCLVIILTPQSLHLLQQPLSVLQPSASSISTSSSSSWLGSFQIPEKYSKVTMERLREEVMTDKLRQEIISAIAIQIYQHTMYPSSEEYTTVCRKLIERYPYLKDKVGNGIVSIATYSSTFYL